MNIFFTDSICSNLCVGPSPKIKNSSLQLSMFVDELISTPKAITFLPVPPLGWEKDPCLLNPIPYPEYLYLLRSAFLVKLTVPNKHFHNGE